MKLNKVSCLRFLLLSLFALMIVCLSVAGLTAWDNARLSKHSEISDKLSQQEKARLIEALHLRQTVGDEVLPGWGRAEIPVILYNEDYAFLTGVNSPPPKGWTTVRLNQQRGTAWEVVPGDDIQGIPYYRQALHSGVDPQSFTVKIGANYAASLTTFEYYHIVMHQQIHDGLPDIVKPVFPYRIATHLLVDSADQYITLILHEAAHAYQGFSAPERLMAGEEANYELEDLYPWEDESLRKDWESELDLLVRALRAQTTEESCSLAREFLQIRNFRRQSAGLSTDLIQFERQREWVEGIGRYAEISVYRLAHEKAAYAPEKETVDDPVFYDYEKFDQRWTRELDQMKRMAQDESERRFYYSGMAQAVLLDRLDPDWKSKIFEPGIWLDGLLEEAVMNTG
jgi:hypothetical protein